MYESFYGFREKPFSLLPDPDFLYMGRQHTMAFAMLEYGVINRAPITVITGEIGAGKTTLIRHLLNRLDEELSVGLIANTHPKFGQVLQWALNAFDLPVKGNNADRYRAFTDYLIKEYGEGKRTVLIVDEAQNMAADALEELRLLSNINADKHQVLQLVLVGQPELRKTLRQPGLEQFVQRVAVAFHIDPLPAPETVKYVRHRLGAAGGDPALFEDEAIEAVHTEARGIPRLINVLCDTALVYGFACQAERIDASVVTDVVNDRARSGLFGTVDESAG